jgi:Poly(ADP-ribose) polymerase and DNA-Ligase Zn-finger region
MSHVFELAPSGRAKCRGCNSAIARGELRFGERLPNPFADGEMTVWFHPLCAAYKRPEPLLSSLGETPESVSDRDRLERAARNGVAHRRLPRIDGAERAPSAQAKCRHCHERIERGTWRVRLAYWEDGRFSGGGYVHLACRKDYFETDDVLDRLLHFSPQLGEAERDELTRACAG